ALAISQPTLSHQIAQLEATLGVILVERGTRLLRLTARGELLAGRASRILGLLDETIDLLDSHDDKKELRIGIPSYMSYPAVTELLASFREVA
ncbi:LysR family transcriptional regulator, partial [Escherichia coli]|uniref:LysR family transcriptional regulator n=2 Tax=Pseudomonadota TaxID=1224 RepID=UPI0015E5EF4F